MKTNDFIEVISATSANRLSKAKECLSIIIEQEEILKSLGFDLDILVEYK